MSIIHIIKIKVASIDFNQLVNQFIADSSKIFNNNKSFFITHFIAHGYVNLIYLLKFGISSTEEWMIF